MRINCLLLKVRGRLGNQLFQLATAKALSKRTNTYVIFDLDGHFSWDRFFVAPFYFRVWHKIAAFVVKKTFLRRPFYRPWIVPNNELINLDSVESRSRVIQGYFQSPAYFLDLSLEDSMFNIKPWITRKFHNLYGDLVDNTNTVFVHIRRSDYVDVRKKELGNTTITLPAEYYNACLEQIDSDKRKRIIVLSDDVSWVKQNITWATEFIHNEAPIFDFMLMAHARCLVISNSTFSWWAAYLNQVADAIYAPLYFLGYNAGMEYPAGIRVGTRFNWVHH